MPEYLAPGVYIEETSYRAKSIEGVATSTTGFVGQCRWGPVEDTPKLVTSFEEFKRAFGGLNDLDLGAGPVTNYLAFAAKAFFENGGRRLYVARVHNGGTHAESALIGTTGANFVARFPGAAGDVTTTVEVYRSKNLLSGFGTSSAKISGIRHGDLVEVTTSATPLADGVTTSVSTALYRGEYQEDGTLHFVGATDNLDEAGIVEGGGTAYRTVQRLTLKVTVASPDRTDVYANLSPHPESTDYIGRYFRADDPPDDYVRITLSESPALTAANTVALLQALMAGPAGGTAGVWPPATSGTDGAEAGSTEYGGSVTAPKSGLSALGDIDDIAIVAAPGASAHSDATTRQDLRNQLITHCETLMYRFAILSVEETATVEDVRELRAQHDSKYAALYFPWVVIKDPNGAAGDVLTLPPDGFMAGIYGRSDTERGVHKAPANEVVRGALRFSVNISKGTQDVLNPEGINCLRFFEGRGYRVWGARTLSSDPEWKYLNVRRLFIYLERSIDLNTQWVVFEPNNEALWLRVRMTIESFLTDVWRTGAFMGTAPKEAFFVKCDRATMTQGDLDNGRLIVLIGVAPTKPAEFVIFRIGQWTADSSTI